MTTDAPLKIQIMRMHIIFKTIYLRDSRSTTPASLEMIFLSMIRIRYSTLHVVLLSATETPCEMVAASISFRVNSLP
jgi:hypothetical protein